ncbi:unknown [Coraliomargarita sp. CAG:312]|nr:unknown [Coraliomargarita sp. CAG:312]
MQQVAYNNEKLFHLLASVNILILEGLAGIFCP